VIKICTIALCLFVLMGCSVKMAATKKGVEANDILSCRSEVCIQGLKDTEVLHTEDMEQGRVVTYRSLQKQGSATRAVMHGLLDVITLGVWEVAGTPIEGSKSNERFYVYKITYDSDGNIINASIDVAN